MNSDHQPIALIPLVGYPAAKIRDQKLTHKCNVENPQRIREKSRATVEKYLLSGRNYNTSLYISKERTISLSLRIGEYSLGEPHKKNTKFSLLNFSL